MCVCGNDNDEVLGYLITDDIYLCIYVYTVYSLLRKNEVNHLGRPWDDPAGGMVEFQW